MKAAILLFGFLSAQTLLFIFARSMGVDMVGVYWFNFFCGVAATLNLAWKDETEVIFG